MAKRTRKPYKVTILRSGTKYSGFMGTDYFAQERKELAERIIRATIRATVPPEKIGTFSIRVEIRKTKLKHGTRGNA